MIKSLATRQWYPRFRHSAFGKREDLLGDARYVRLGEFLQLFSGPCPPFGSVAHSAGEISEDRPPTTAHQLRTIPLTSPSIPENHRSARSLPF